MIKLIIVVCGVIFFAATIITIVEQIIYQKDVRINTKQKEISEQIKER